jgi:hypothetical protein
MFSDPALRASRILVDLQWENRGSRAVPGPERNRKITRKGAKFERQ